MAPTTRSMASKRRSPTSETPKTITKVVKKQSPKSGSVSKIKSAKSRNDAKKKRKKADPPVSKFFKLPLELRLEIYNGCLVAKEALKLKLTIQLRRRRSSNISTDFPDDDAIISKRAKFSVSLSSDQWGPSLVLVNRQIYIETIPILYGLNQFEFFKWKDFEYFRTISGERCISHMRSVSVPFPVPRCLMDPFKIELGLWERKGLRYLIKTSSLKVLTFRISHDLSVEDYRFAWRTLLKEIPKPCKVYLQCDENLDRSDRSIKLTKKAVDAVLKRGWEFKGPYTIRDSESRP